VKTPGFDRVARGGILFTHAFTPNAKCAPSRACILTGRNSWQLEEGANHICFFPAKFKTYAEALGEHGYVVGMTAKGWAPGVANDAQGKPRQMAGKPFDRKKHMPPTTQMNRNDYAANFEEFLGTVGEGKPWCFWYGATEPHRGYEYGSGVAKGHKRLGDIDRVPAMWPDNEVVRNDMLDYAFEVENFDAHLVRMLEMIEKRGELENTLVVVTSDNGMPFPRVKGQEYFESNRLPLAVMWSGGIRGMGRVVDDYVSFIDFAPTFLELAGVKGEDTGMQPITGRSLTEIFRADGSGRVIGARDHVLIGKERHDVGRPDDVGYPIRGIVKDDLIYLINFEPGRWPSGNPEVGYPNVDGGPTKTEVLKTRKIPELGRLWELSFGRRPGEEFYDARKDPECMENLVGRPEFEAARVALRKQLLEELTAQQDPRMFGHGDVFDKYPYADEKFRDYYNRYIKGENLKANWISESDIEKDPPK